MISLSLRQWIDGALESIDVTAASAPSSADEHRAIIASVFGDADPRKLALSSDAFLSSALRVARSLADQVVRRKSGSDLDENGLANTEALPTDGSTDWSEGVTVHLSDPSSSDREHNFGSNCDVNDDGHDGINRALTPAPFSHLHDKEPLAQPEELRDMFRLMIGDDAGDGLLEIDDKANDSPGAELDPLMISESLNFDSSFGPLNYLEVSGANLTYNKIDSNGRGEKQDEMRQLYSLGLVFYEIFSGGEKPEIKMSSDRSQEPELLEDVGQESWRSSLSLKNGHSQPSRPINIADTVKINGDGDIDDLFSSSGKHPHSDSDAEHQNLIRELVMKKSPKIIAKDTHPVAVSLEQLKSKGLPISLTDLIGNMLSAIHGDLSGKETYQSVVDVLADLQRMLDKPRVYLDDLDLAKLSVTGLQLNDTVFEREEEFEILRGAYRRSIGGGCELTIVSGTSGTGKSVLAHRFGSHVVAASGAIFLSGKFDQLQQATPFSAISAAFNQYCDMLISEGINTSARASKVASELNRVLGSEAHHLARIIPSLATVMGQDDGQCDIAQGCVDPQKRLLYLLCQFVEVISCSSGVPITLFLDDLQWADPSSIAVIHQLLLVSRSLNKTRQFFVLGCVRKEEAGNNLPFTGMVSSICNIGMNVTTINLTCMDEDTISALVSEVLCLSPRLTRSLGHIVYHKTKGNPLFFSQLMISLNRDGLLQPSLRRCRWEWDEEKIRLRKIPDDVAMFLSINIERLPKEEQMALSLLSCFGASTKITLVEALETTLQMSLINSLEKSVAEGLLDKANGSYSFCHDRLQEASYNMMRQEERCLFHFKYGVALISCSLGSQDDAMLFIATNQLNRGGPSAVEDKEQGILVANLNLTAGKKAMEMSDFSTAYSYFDHGISFLRKRHWTEQYQLSLDLFDNAAKCALFIGNIISLKLLSQQVLTFAQTFQDKLEVLFVTVSGLAKCEPREAANKAISVLSNLGEHFSDSYSEADICMQVEKTKVMLQQYTAQEIINHKQMVHPSKIMAMKFLARLELLILLTQPSWQPAVTLKMIQLSMKYGHSPISPLAFTYFGMLLARLGNIREGYSYVKMGRKLLDRPGYNEVAGEVISMATQVMCFVEPVQSANEFFLQGQAAAMSAGDMNNAIMSSLVYSVGSYWAGVKLPTVRENFTASRSMMEKQGNLMWLAHQAPLERSMLILIGVDERELPDHHDLGKTSPHATLLNYFNKMYLAFMFRDFEQTKVFAEEYYCHNNIVSFSLLYIHTAQAFIGGLVAFSISRKSNNPIWADRGSKAKCLMKKWADSCNWNFQSKLYLIEAEEAYCSDDICSAKSLYEKAISSARAHRFIHEEALACELAGHFCLDIGQKNEAVNYFLQAHEKYHDWGAIAKANALYEFATTAF